MLDASSSVTILFGLGILGNIILFSFIVPIIDNSGKEFYIMFMANEVETPLNGPMEIFVTSSKPNVSVTVSTPLYSADGWDGVSVVLNANEVQKITVPNGIKSPIGTAKGNLGVLVTATEDIVVYGVNLERFSSDAFLALPVKALGYQYYAVTYFPATTSCEIGVVATSDRTKITFTLPNFGRPVNVEYNNDTYGNGQTFEVTLNKYETFHIQSPNDLTGTEITSTKPIAVFSGNQRTSVGSGVSRDHLVEQLPPTNAWGKEFATVPIPGRTTGDVFKIVTSNTSNIQIVRSGQSAENRVISGSGNYLELNIDSDEYTKIVSDQPVLVVQIVKSQTDASTPEKADPSMIIIPPIEQYKDSYTLSTPLYSGGSGGITTDYTNYFMLVVNASAMEDFVLDGEALVINSSNWNPIPDSSLMATYVNLDSGSHTLKTTSGATFMGILYGTADRETYGFPVGMNAEIIQEVSWCAFNSM